MPGFNSEFRVLEVISDKAKSYTLIHLEDKGEENGIPSVEMVHALTSEDIAEVIETIKEKSTRMVTHVDFTFARENASGKKEEAGKS